MFLTHTQVYINMFIAIYVIPTLIHILYIIEKLELHSVLIRIIQYSPLANCIFLWTEHNRIYNYGSVLVGSAICLYKGGKKLEPHEQFWDPLRGVAALGSPV